MLTNEANIAAGIDARMSSVDILDPRMEGRHILRTDPHCHILPGLDDGSPNLKMSFKMARRMVQAGVQTVIATPHGVHPAIDTNVHPDFLREQVQNLNDALQREGIPLQVFPGTEIYLRSRIIEIFDKGQLITWADQGRFILVELGFQRCSDNLLWAVDELIARGLTPIIAHPERYLWLPQQPKLFTELRDRGCVFQFNMMSINGHFGPRLKGIVLRLMQHAGEFIIGSDSHSDNDKYFNVTAAQEQLKTIGLLSDDGQVLPGTKKSTPDLDVVWD